MAVRYIEELSGEALDATEFTSIGIDAYERLNRNTPHHMNDGEAVLVELYPGFTGSLFGLHDDGGREGAMWYPIHAETESND